MRRTRHAALLAFCVLLASSCRGGRTTLLELRRSPTVAARESRLQKALADHETLIAERPVARWILPAPLREISGVAPTRDGRLLAHGDENGEVWEVDYRRGILVKHFFLGENGVKGDFEGITVANDLVFLFTSTAKLYAFHEGPDGAHVNYEEIDTGLKKECEFEGVAFDPTINSLLLACKHIHDKDVHDAIVIYRWSLAPDTTARLSKLTIPLGNANGGRSFHPSDITIDPITRNYVLLSSLERALIEVTPAGALVFSRPLPDGHQQPEGIAITNDSILIVSDEAKTGPALITLYKWQ
jgi:uncharacterized protein YjiK